MMRALLLTLKESSGGFLDRWVSAGASGHVRSESLKQRWRNRALLVWPADPVGLLYS
jgi:hypothetical protein